MSDTLTAAELDELERLEEAACEGPWVSVPGGRWCGGKSGAFPNAADIVTEWTHQDVYKSGKKKGQPKGKAEPVPVAVGIIFPACSDARDAAFIAASRNAFRALLALARKGLECDEDRTTYLRVLAGMAGERDALAAELAELRKACASLTPLIESVNRNKIPDQVPLGIDIERVGGAPTVGDLRRIDAAFALTLLSELKDKS